MRHVSLTILLVLLAALCPATARAGGINIKPVKVYMAGHARTTTITLRNENDFPLIFQVQSIKWSQNSSGSDVHMPTDEIVVFPKIFKLESGSEQIIRIGLRTGEPEEKEDTYRIFINELPIAQQTQSAVGMAMRYSLPLFVLKERRPPLWEISSTKAQGGRIDISIRNSGQNHIRLNKIVATAMDEGGRQIFSREIRAWYVLRGITRLFPLDVDPEECKAIQTLRIKAEAEHSSREAEFAFDREGCQRQAVNAQGAPKK